MRAAIWDGPGKMSVGEVPDATCPADGVLLRVTACGICGTDVRVFFNGDRRIDVAIVNLQSSDLSILFGRGDGTFEYPPRNYRTKPGPFALATFRVTTKEDEEPGLVTADNGSGSVSIFLHRGLKAVSAFVAPPP